MINLHESMGPGPAGRVLDLGPTCPCFETRMRHCAVTLNKTILSFIMD